MKMKVVVQKIFINREDNVKLNNSEYAFAIRETRN